MGKPKILIEGIPLEKLLECYYKDMERKKRNLETNKRYRKTEARDMIKKVITTRDPNREEVNRSKTF